MYVTVFRGTPMIVQAMVIYYGIAQVFGVNIPAFQAAILIITLNSGAYMRRDSPRRHPFDRPRPG